MPERPDRFTAENALLIAATRGDDGWAAPAGRLNIEYLLRAALAQGVAPLLYEWLGRHPGIVEDEAALSALHNAFWTEHFRSRLLLRELTDLSRRAAESGIEVMPMKGAHLAPAFYPKPALRPLSDLDLLVRARDVERLAAILEERGFTSLDPEPSYVQGEHLDAGSREYCWSRHRDGLELLVEYRASPLELTVGRLTDLDDDYRAVLRRHAAAVWERSAAAPGGAGRVMSPEDVLLQVATHLAAKHVAFRLIWLHDIARLVEGAPHMDWAYLASWTKDLRVAAPVSAALEAARRHAAAAVTDAQLDAVRAGLGSPSRLSLAQRDLRRLSRCIDELPSSDLTVKGPAVWPLGAALSRVRGVRARMRVVRWVLLPGRDYLEQRGHQGTGAIRGFARRIARRARATLGRGN